MKREKNVIRSGEHTDTQQPTEREGGESAREIGKRKSNGNGNGNVNGTSDRVREREKEKEI